MVRKIPLIISATLVLLIVLDLFSCVARLGNDNMSEYESALEKADDYYSRELYQLAIQEYESALELKDTEEVRDKLIDAYDLRYKEDKKFYESYLTKMQSLVQLYPNNIDYYLILARLYCDKSDYQKAYELLNEVKKKSTNEELESLLLEIRYAYEIDWAAYEEFLPCTNGLYAVRTDCYWDYISEIGETKTADQYIFASQVGEDGAKLVLEGIKDPQTADEPYEEEKLPEKYRIELLDTDIVRGRAQIKIDSAGVFSEDLIPIKKDGRYGYYDSLCDYQFGDYEYAGKFTDGTAAVKKSDGNWYLIDNTGEAKSKNTYEDIKLGLDTSCFVNGIMVAKQNGKYNLFDVNENKINSIEADEMDIPTEDGLIAFKKGDKWGYVNTKGDIITEPAYDCAKSFSNGLAAVQKENKWGFINSDGILVIDNSFFEADYFNDEQCCFVKPTEKKWRLLKRLVEE